MLWRLMPVLAAALVLGGSAYIVVRTHRFGFLQALAQRHKLLSWLLALIPMGLVGLVGLAFNITAMAVVFLHLLLAWLLCDGVWLIVRPHLKKPVQHYWAGAAALALTVLYLGRAGFSPIMYMRRIGPSPRTRTWAGRAYASRRWRTPIWASL